MGGTQVDTVGFLPRLVMRPEGGANGLGLSSAAASLQQLLNALHDKEPSSHPASRVASARDGRSELVFDCTPRCRSSSLPALANSVRVSTSTEDQLGHSFASKSPASPTHSMFGGVGFPSTPFRRHCKADRLRQSEEAGRLRTLLQRREAEAAQQAESSREQLAEAAAKYSEDLGRAAELLQERERELRQAKAQHSEEVSRLRAQHARELEEARAHRKKKAAQELLELRAERDALQKRVRALERVGAQQEDTDVSKLRATHAAELQKAKSYADSKLTELDSLKAEVAALQAQASELTKAKSQASEELASLKAQRQRDVKRLEAEAGKQLEDYDDFLKQLVGSSSLPSLKQEFDLDRAKVLGMGNIGFVFTCKAKSGGQAVLKVQGEKRAGVTAKEWAHGSTLAHKHIVRYLDVFMHSDTELVVHRILEAAFDTGVLTGKRPYVYPQSYFCLSLEYMDQGTVQRFMDGGHCTLESVAAVTRQIASALAYMHERQRTHNDVKPENILLQTSPGGNYLVAKLADFGLAEHSVDLSRDSDLFGYTVWCMALGHRFERCPRGRERRDAARELRGRAPRGQQDRQLADALAAVVGGMWEDTLTMLDVERMNAFDGLEVRMPSRREHAVTR